MNESSSALQTISVRRSEQFADSAITRDVELRGVEIGLKYLSQSVSRGDTGLQTAHQISPGAAQDATQPYDVWRRPQGVYVYPLEAKLVQFCLARASATKELSDQPLSTLLEGLLCLRNDSDEWQPSEFAYWNAVRILSEAYSLLKLIFPRYWGLPSPALSADSDGAVRCRWVIADREVRVNFAGQPHLKSYIYFEQEPVYKTEALTSDALARRLSWLVER